VKCNGRPLQRDETEGLISSVSSSVDGGVNQGSALGGDGYIREKGEREKLLSIAGQARHHITSLFF